MLQWLDSRETPRVAPFQARQDYPTVTSIFSAHPGSPEINATDHATPSESSLTLKLTRNQKNRSQDRPITVQANLYPLVVEPGARTTTIVERYKVSIQWEAQEIPSSFFSTFLGELQKCSEDFSACHPVFDGDRYLYCTRELALLGMTLQRGNQTFTFSFQPSPEPAKPTGAAALSIPCLEAVLDRGFEPTHLQMMRSFYPRQATAGNIRSIGGNAELWTGHYQSVLPTESGVMVNMDVCTAVMMEPLPLLEHLCKRFRLPHPGSIECVQRVDLEKMVAGLKVEITHRGNQKRKFRVLGLTGKNAKEETFEVEPGKPISVEAYFHQTYNIKLRFPNLPCLQCGSSRKAIALPMECVRLAKGQTYSRPLEAFQRAKMLTTTCSNPKDRQKSIQNALALSNINGMLQHYGMHLDPEMVQTKARILEPPQLVYSSIDGADRKAIVKPVNGVWMLRDLQFARPALLEHLAVGCFCEKPSNELRASITSFLNDLLRTCRNKGMMRGNFPTPTVHMLTNHKDMEKSLRSVTCTSGQTPQLYLLFLPSDKVPYYGEIKWVSETVLGIPSQCMDYHKLRDKRQTGLAYQVNLAMKMNAKMGGSNNLVHCPNRDLSVNHRESIPSHALSVPTNTLILSYEIQPIYAATKVSPLILSMVGTKHNSATSRHFTATREYPNPSALSHAIQELLRQYISTGEESTFPDSLLIYRNSRRYKELEDVVEQEHKAILQGIQSLAGDYRPHITMLSVHRKNHVRLFSEDPRNVDKNGNMLAGTIVDETITSPTHTDFYLYSHAGLKGTSKPTYYRIVSHEMQLSLEGVEQLTYELCHLYARCLRSVSVPSVVLYARLAMQRAKLYINHPGISKMMMERAKVLTKPSVKMLPRVRSSSMASTTASEDGTRLSGSLPFHLGVSSLSLGSGTSGASRPSLVPSLSWTSSDGGDAAERPILGGWPWAIMPHPLSSSSQDLSSSTSSSTASIIPPSSQFLSRTTLSLNHWSHRGTSSANAAVPRTISKAVERPVRAMSGPITAPHRKPLLRSSTTLQQQPVVPLAAHLPFTDPSQSGSAGARFVMEPSSFFEQVHPRKESNSWSDISTSSERQECRAAVYIGGSTRLQNVLYYV